MKILLHMGQSKTGTSSLQESLHAAADRLRDRGVLYPSFGPKFVNHQLLMALCGAPDRLPPWRLESLGGPQGAVNAAQIAWAATCEEIRHHRPELLVLSSEHIVHQTDGLQKKRLAEVLSPLSSDITPVIYVRHPVDHYRSRLQQSIKHRDRHYPPVGPKLKEAVLDSEAAFGRSPKLVCFDRKTLLGGDVVFDFATRFLSPWMPAEDLPSLNTNIGLSAEALVLLFQMRAEAGGTYEASRQVARLIPLIESVDQGDPPSQPLTLLPEVADAALRTATGHRWLVETGRLQIPGLDINRIDGTPTPAWMRKVPPIDLILHDPERLERLREAVKQHQAKKSVRKKTAYPSEKPKPRIHDLLLRFLLGKLASTQDRNTGAAPRRIRSAQGSSQGERNEDH